MSHQREMEETCFLVYEAVYELVKHRRQLLF